MSIRLWIVLLINLLIILIVSPLSFFFYRQFQDTLDQRVLLQLNSIKRLKQVQIEKYLQTEWQTFLNAKHTMNWKALMLGAEVSNVSALELESLNMDCLRQKLSTEMTQAGIHDLSSCSTDGQTRLGLVYLENEKKVQLQIIGIEKMQKILLERTGMGESGETYLVSSDLKLRSASRFFPERPPNRIVANTVPVQQALKGRDGTGVFADYRGVEVYSAFDGIDIGQLNWVILSEIDVEEVNIPLQELRKKLLINVLIMVFVALILSLLIARFLAAPLLKMQGFLNKMSLGIYDVKTQVTQPTAKEMREMFHALEDLRHSISQVIQFSSEIGNMNLDAQYVPASEEDVLGKSLIQMRQKLLEYRTAARRNSSLAKQSLIRGQENERKRLSRELHDGLGPLLTTIKLGLQTTQLPSEEKSKLTSMVDKTIDEIRRMSYDLMPAALVDFGVGKALQNFVNLIQPSTPINILYSEDIDDPEDRLDLDVDICIYRIGQELIHNSIKHSKAKKITISLTKFSDRISLYYTDDGIGFDPNASYAGSGLKNIRERIETLNGFIEISSDQTGTIVEVEIPLMHE